MIKFLTLKMAQFICPITQSIMTDPCLAMDGFCYERSAIAEWLKNNDTSPNTREKIGKTLITNHAMRSELSAAGHPVKSLNNTTVINTGTSLRITLVLDVSGSMDSSVENKNTNEPSFSRLDLIKHAVCSISAMMRDGDQLSIVTFSDTANVVMPWTKMDNIGKVQAQRIGMGLYVQGGTNIPAGIEMGVSQGGDHTILLTDGANNVSNPPRGTLGDYIIGKVSNYRGKIHSVGLGMAEDLDTPTLRAVSSSKGGLYCFCPDASMVGTVFIHLMANICINEPGTPFEDHDHFVETITLASVTKNLDLVRNTKFDDPVINEDLVSVHDNKGQVEKALINWHTWGRHYLPAFIDAHMRCMTTNFKDASLQGYATPNTRAFIDAGEMIFLGIVPPTPSCNNRNGYGYNAVQFTSTTMDSQGACFGPDTMITVLDVLGVGTVNVAPMVFKSIPIKDIKKGMFVYIGSDKKSMTKVKCLVVSPATEMIKVKGIWISKKHPLLVTNNWQHAQSCYHNGNNIQVKQCFNMVLEAGHTLNINGNEEITAVTLGHNLKGDVVEHDYLGTDRIINDLSKCPGWNEGYVEIKGFKRNNTGFLCGIEL